ncbi:TOBE domain-containing protein [Rubrivivax rivuli]|uniref:LysR family transcriptional regulator n=1 Tax=Rubrivivax rivuli TaxID=1862385 RepID=A0A437RA87_9BURK|nr:TOBE domain-containing protein [Rubrivivax rivuli]RVU43698.1 LysR family transcriptional regulator [Rubrivivax rivuli]
MPSRSSTSRHRPALAEVLGQASTDKRIDILRRLGECGSISEAARQAGVSYKAAWQALETLSNLAGTPLVAKAVGGSGGGGAQLTAAGLQVLQAAAQLDAARTQVLAALAPGESRSGPGLAALALRTSLRNQLPCAVSALRQTAGQVRVALALRDGQLLHARITRESAQLLQLAPGLAVLALCKATAVRVAPTLAAADGRNLLQGTVSRASRAATGGEVALQLPGPLSLVGFSTGTAGLRAGQPAMAAIDEAGVVIASTG